MRYLFLPEAVWIHSFVQHILSRERSFLESCVVLLWDVFCASELSCAFISRSLRYKHSKTIQNISISEITKMRNFSNRLQTDFFLSAFSKLMLSDLGRFRGLYEPVLEVVVSLAVNRLSVFDSGDCIFKDFFFQTASKGYVYNDNKSPIDSFTHSLPCQLSYTSQACSKIRTNINLLVKHQWETVLKCTSKQSFCLTTL